MEAVNRREFLAATSASAATLALPCVPVANEVPAEIEPPAPKPDDDVKIGRQKLSRTIKLLDGRIVTVAAWQYGLLTPGGSICDSSIGSQGPKENALCHVGSRFCDYGQSQENNPPYSHESRVIEVSDIDPSLLVPKVTYKDGERRRLSVERAKGLSELWITDMCRHPKPLHAQDIRECSWPLVVKTSTYVRVVEHYRWSTNITIACATVEFDVIAWVSRTTERWCLLAAIREHIDKLISASPAMPNDAALQWDSRIVDFARLE